MDKPAPHCSAQSWSIFDQKSNTLLFGKLEKERREVASLTKIMTCYLVFQLLERFEIPDDTLIEVSGDAAGVIGTSADLLEGDTLSIWQLLHGLMLPSGNDAAHCLAEYFGGLLKDEATQIEEKEKKDELQRIKEEEVRLEKLKEQGDQIGSGLESIQSNLPTASTNHTT